jgi:hypothetical protein
MRFAADYSETLEVFFLPPTMCGNFVESGSLILSQKLIPHNAPVSANSPFHRQLTEKRKDCRLCHLLAAKKTLPEFHCNLPQTACG